MTQPLSVLIPAAGASRRMRGQDKLLIDAGQGPLLQVMANRALAVADQVIVTLPSLTHPRARALTGSAALVVAVPDAQDGMSASLRRGALQALPMAGLMILPADMPDLSEADLRQIRTAFDQARGEKIIQGTSATGTPGHPVVFPAFMVAEFSSLSGDTGARAILQRHSAQVHRVALPENHALTDLDTPEAWRAWRAANP